MQLDKIEDVLSENLGAANAASLAAKDGFRNG